MSRKLLGLAIVVFSGAAQADGAYSLSVVKEFNPFSPAGTVLSDTIPGQEPLIAAGNCTVVGAAVTCTGIQFSAIGSSRTFNYSNGSWSTTLGGASIAHTETCIQSAGTPCTSSISGLTGQWTTGFMNGGSPSSTCSASNYFAAGACDQVSVVENAGVSLTIMEQSEFGLANTPYGYRYEFVAVPLPGALGVFGGALACLPLLRRRMRPGRCWPVICWRRMKSDGASS